ncbi:MAG: hypothetical protein A3H42_00160 [Deltaproteobacteria bacterium RIFCSPLOWO2_02_FULL_46_8]|nr:MAG: hypothetical protein A3H42_00160 [Deltaproteobacteria bacterium RIFCSPLOWO2_02_FULL_46_8]
MILVWLFLAWLWIDQTKKDCLRKEIARGEAYAMTLAASNRTPLQNQLEPLVSLGDLLQQQGVVEAIISDFQGKVLVPLQHFGEKDIFLQKKVGDLVFKKEIVGLNQENLGTAHLLFHPDAPSFYGLQSLFLSPVLGVIVFCLYFSLHRKEESASKPLPEPICQPSLDWIPLLRQWVGKEVYLFDEEGNLLACSSDTNKAHLLDLFPEPKEAQNILTLFQKIKEDENSVTHLDGEKIRMGSWREKDGTKRFLLACH